MPQKSGYYERRELGGGKLQNNRALPFLRMDLQGVTASLRGNDIADSYCDSSSYTYKQKAVVGQCDGADTGSVEMLF
jgi:hypothetical protein